MTYEEYTFSASDSVHATERIRVNSRYRKERALLETKSKITHPVYSLYFPEVSYSSTA